MGLAELFKVGFFEAYYNWFTPWLTVAVYALTLLGFILQRRIQGKNSKTFSRFKLIILCAVGAVICEILLDVITGWDRLIPILLYGSVVCVLLGAGISLLVFAVKGKGSHD